VLVYLFITNQAICLLSEFRCQCKQTEMSATLQLELQALQSCVDEDDADRAREVVGNIAQLCLNDVTERNIGYSTHNLSSPLHVYWR